MHSTAAPGNKRQKKNEKTNWQAVAGGVGAWHAQDTRQRKLKDNWGAKVSPSETRPRYRRGRGWCIFYGNKYDCRDPWSVQSGKWTKSSILINAKGRTTKKYRRQRQTKANTWRSANKGRAWKAGWLLNPRPLQAGVWICRKSAQETPLYMPNRKYFAMKTAPVAVGLEWSEVVSFQPFFFSTHIQLFFFFPPS